MRLPKFEHVAPKSLVEALTIYSQHASEASVLAGGTDLVVRLRQRVATPKLVISLNSLPDNNYIVHTDQEGLRIGALTSLHSLETSNIVRQHYPALAEAASKVASPQIRNLATIGGNLCLDTRCWFYNKSDAWRSSRPACHKTGGNICHVVKGSERCYALFTADLALPLIASGASVWLASAMGQRQAILQDIYSGTGQNPLKLAPGEIVTEIRVPPLPASSATGFLKYSFRKAVDFAIASVAVSITPDKKGMCEDARIVMGAVASSPVRATKAEDLLKGNEVTPGLAEQAAALAIKDIGAIVPIGTTVEYKRKIVTFLVRKAIMETWDSARKKAIGKE